MQVLNKPTSKVKSPSFTPRLFARRFYRNQKARSLQRLKTASEFVMPTEGSKPKTEIVALPLSSSPGNERVVDRAQAACARVITQEIKSREYKASTFHLKSSSL